MTLTCYRLSGAGCVRAYSHNCSSTGDGDCSRRQVQCKAIAVVARSIVCPAHAQRPRRQMDLNISSLAHTYLRCVCAGKQASAYTQPSRDRGKGTYIVLTGCVEWREGASSHDHHGGRRHRCQKHVFYFEKNISPEISEHVHTRVPEIFLFYIADFICAYPLFIKVT